MTQYCICELEKPETREGKCKKFIKVISNTQMKNIIQYILLLSVLPIFPIVRFPVSCEMEKI